MGLFGHHNKEQQLLDTVEDTLGELRLAVRELLDSAAYHRASSDNLRDAIRAKAEQNTGEVAIVTKVTTTTTTINN